MPSHDSSCLWHASTEEQRSSDKEVSPVMGRPRDAAGGRGHCPRSGWPGRGSVEYEQRKRTRCLQDQLGNAARDPGFGWWSWGGTTGETPQVNGGVLRRGGTGVPYRSSGDVQRDRGVIRTPEAPVGTESPQSDSDRLTRDGDPVHETLPAFDVCMTMKAPGDRWDGKSAQPPCGPGGLGASFRV